MRIVVAHTIPQVELETIAGMRSGIRKDIADLNRIWPVASRSIRANHCYQRIIAHLMVAMNCADNGLKAMRGKAGADNEV